MTQYEELGFSQLTQMENDHTTNSHYLTNIHFSLKGWENELFSSLINLARLTHAALASNRFTDPTTVVP